MEIRKITPKKPRVALLIHDWFPFQSSEQIYVCELAKFLSQNQGYEVDILTGGGGLGVRKLTHTREQQDFEKLPGIRVKRFPYFSVLSTFFTLLFSWKKYKLMHAQGAKSSVPMKAASWFTRVPTVLTVHANHIFQKMWTIKKILHRVMFLETRYSQEISIAENFLKAKNVNESIAVIPYGIDPAPFEAVSAQKNPEVFKVLYVGYIHYLKGVDVLLRAAQKAIETSNRTIEVHIVGIGPDLSAFRKLTQKLKLQKYVKFHGQKTGEALIEMYKSADLFVMPSRSDALPMSLFEACAARLPILASNVGDMRKLVIENTNGHLVEPEDEEELAYYLGHFASNPHLENMGQASFDLVTQEYPLEAMLQKTLHVYDSLEVARESQKTSAPQKNLFMPWQLPALFLRQHRLLRPSKNRSALAPLKFCFTVNVSQPEGSSAAKEEVSAGSFFQLMTEFCQTHEIPATFFIQSDLFESNLEAVRGLTQGGHEVGVHVLPMEWNGLPTRKKTARTLRETFDHFALQGTGPQGVHMFRAPGEISLQDLEYLHESGFDFLPTSEDPLPRISWKLGLPFGQVQKMNLSTFLKLRDKELFVAIHRLHNSQKTHGIEPFLIFECDSTEFKSSEEFTALSKKLMFLKECFALRFMTLSDFCKSCSVKATV